MADVMEPDARPLKVYMERHGLSQTEFAERIGASQAAVSQWLKGKLRMSARRASAIEKRTKGEIRRADILPRLFE